MICDCGYLDMVLVRERDLLNVALSRGVATVRPVGATVRVEHLDCGKCVGISLRAVDPLGDAGCGCQDKTPVVPSTGLHASSSSLFLRSGACSCGTMLWEDARDGALILEGPGDYQVWDRESDGAVVMVGGRCWTCGALDHLHPAPLSSRAQT